MTYNICLIQPPGYIHSNAFVELGELIHFSLLELGSKSEIAFNSLNRRAINIVIGIHLLTHEQLTQIPKNSIVVNTEQILKDESNWVSRILRASENFKLWDYSVANIEAYEKHGIFNVKHLELGFQKELVRVPVSKVKDIDILFYGSLNDKRRLILDELSSKGVRVKTLFGVYGAERDAYISRSEIVLNHHMYKSEIFEVVRVFYLMTNSIAVVGEVNDSTSIEPRFLSGIKSAKYEELVASCLELLGSEVALFSYREKAYEEIKRYPQRDYTANLLDSN